MDAQIRAARQSDEPLLWDLLAHAFAWRENALPPSRDELRGSPTLALYVAGWGRAGDRGVVAESSGREPVGAAWYRLFPEEAHGYGFVEADVPELTIAVRPDARGLGVGTALLEALLEAARESGGRALSLSVEDGNPAARLYARLGFTAVGRAGTATTMLVELG